MKSLNEYQKYKNSEVEWLGEIPSHWEVLKLKNIVSLSKGRNAQRYNKDYVLDPLNKGEHPVYSGQTENNGVLGKINSFEYDIKSGILATTVGAKAMTPIHVKGKMSLSQNCMLITSNSKFLDNDFLYYFTDPLFSHEKNLIPDFFQPSFRIEDIKKYLIALPTIKEQKAIANYLDDKVGDITDLIHTIDDQIKNLKDYKKVMIKDVITGKKILTNKSVLYKKSNVEWLGNIPNHWKTKRIKDIFEISRGRVVSKEMVLDEGEYPVYSSQTKNNGVLGYIDKYDFSGEYLTWTTDGVNAGTVFIRSGKFNCTNVCGLLKLKKQYKKQFILGFLYYITKIIAKENKRDDINGGKLMSNEMGNLEIFYPEETKEQEVIAEFLDDKINNIESLVKKLKEEKQNLIDYKKVLINDVVTGKIKVYNEEIN